MAETHGALRSLLAIFGFQVDDHELKKGEAGLEHFAEQAKKVGEAVAAAFAVREIYEFIESNVKAVTAIEHTAAQLGISADRVQEFQFAAKSLGLEADGLLNSMGRLQVQQQGAATGSKQAAGAFASLGVKVKGANGEFKDADELFLDVADGISKLTSPSKQAAVAVQLFGRQGRQLLPFLKEGRDGAEKLAAEYKKLGGAYSEDTIAKTKEFEQESARLDLTITGLKNKILNAMLPSATKFAKALEPIVKYLGDVVKNTNILPALLYTLGAAAVSFGIKMAIANPTLVAVSVAIIAVTAAVDDLIALFNGKGSVIGHYIDEIFGKGSRETFVEHAKLAWDSLTESIKEAGIAFRGFLGLADQDQEKAAKGTVLKQAEPLNFEQQLLAGNFGVKAGIDSAIEHAKAADAKRRRDANLAKQGYSMPGAAIPEPNFTSYSSGASRPQSFSPPGGDVYHVTVNSTANAEATANEVVNKMMTTAKGALAKRGVSVSK